MGKSRHLICRIYLLYAYIYAISTSLVNGIRICGNIIMYVRLSCLYTILGKNYLLLLFKLKKENNQSTELSNNLFVSCSFLRKLACIIIDILILFVILKTYLGFSILTKGNTCNLLFHIHVL